MQQAIGVTVREQYERHPFPPEDRRGLYLPHGEYLRQRVFGNNGVGKRVLEAGCGRGVMITDIASVNPHPEYVCLDFCGESIRQANEYRGKNLQERSYLERMQFVQGDIFNPQLEGGFDLVESWGVLHHTENPEQAFKAIAAFLNSRGYIRIGVYGERGNEERRAQIRLIQSLVSRLPLDEKIRVTRAFMNTPDYKPGLCEPPLYHPNRCPKGKSPATDEEIVDEFLHSHETHVPLRDAVRWFEEASIDVLELTDWNNNPISLDLKFHTCNTVEIERFESLRAADKIITPEQAEVIDYHAKPYWIALLGRKRFKLTETERLEAARRTEKGGTTGHYGDDVEGYRQGAREYWQSQGIGTSKIS